MDHLIAADWALGEIKWRITGDVLNAPINKDNRPQWIINAKLETLITEVQLRIAKAMEFSSGS